MCACSYVKSCKNKRNVRVQLRQDLHSTARRSREGQRKRGSFFAMIHPHFHGTRATLLLRYQPGRSDGFDQARCCPHGLIGSVHSEAVTRLVASCHDAERQLCKLTKCLCFLEGISQPVRGCDKSCHKPESQYCNRITPMYTTLSPTTATTLRTTEL